ncbi:hypothetical protein O6H91_Y471800 [Diphasiastrum complanatum]|nr:hypothetical protein O6H91_Y471800 [Diphasiastrum complanatum]
MGDRGEIVAILEAINKTSIYGPDITHLRATIRYEKNHRLHVHITDNDNSRSRWEIPQEIIPRARVSAQRDKEADAAIHMSTNPCHQLLFVYTKDPFGFAVIRNPGGEVLFNSTPSALFGGMVFKDQYLEISTSVSKSASLYGFGERTKSQGFKLLPGQTYTLWASDTVSSNPDMNLYGSHPFYLDVRPGGQSHGVLLLNSNGMDVSYHESHLTYEVIGGILDFYFFAGPSPLSVIEQFTELVGRPAPMPYWSLGFHQCRWGYKSVAELEDVVHNYKVAEIPLEVIWSDIDYMDARKDFTLDPENFPAQRMGAFLDKLHKNNQRYVLIADPGIKCEKNYNAFERGLEADIFIKDSTGTPYLGQVWPGAVHFADFLHPNISSFWTSAIADFHRLVPFDGLWLDMNEVSNFCSGVTCKLPQNTSCLNDEFLVVTCCLICQDEGASNWDNPPYKINNANTHREVGAKTMPTSATHYNGILEYNAHNIYGLSQAIITNKALRSVLRKRPFVLSRSTFVGSGKFAAHWTGDNSATWSDLASSLVSILNSGLVGIPMVGSDICGYLENTTEELCNRWIQVGAFYPFSRSHSDIRAIPQELYVWESVAKSAKKALGLRYQLLPYLYTLVFEAHTTGAPIVRPLFISFPDDPISLGINSQFLLGKSVLVSPVISKGATSVYAYFPKGTWYNLFNYSVSLSISEGSYQHLPALLDTINVHVYDGSIIPMQEEALTTTLARTTPFTLLVAFSLEDHEEKANTASGKLFLDDGEAMEMKIKAGKSTLVQYSAERSKDGGFLRAEVIHGQFALKEGYFLQKLVMLGLNSTPKFLTINSRPASSSIRVSFEEADHVAEICGLKLAMGSSFSINWITSTSVPPSHSTT